MDKTYAEVCGEPAFDWYKALGHPPTTGTVAHYALSAKAINWTTCACGNQCAIIPRNSSGGPIDGTLGNLGGIFYVNVRHGDWSEARTTLAAIEARSAVLIREELAKRNAQP